MKKNNIITITEAAKQSLLRLCNKELEKRKNNGWYLKVWDYDHKQAHNMFTQLKTYTWKDVFNK